MKYCCDCGAEVKVAIPEGDNRPRYICHQCHTIHYQNPRIITGCLVSTGDQVLLCRRAIEPRMGFWTTPAGFMENGETMMEGGARETEEEAAAKVKNVQLYRLFDIPHIHQVYVFFRGELDGEFGVGPESLESRLFAEADIPWSELAFPIVTDLLTEYFDDRRAGQYPVRVSKPSARWASHTGQKMVN